MFNSIPAINSFAPTESSRPKMPQLPDFNKKTKTDQAKESVENLEKGDTITISDPNNSSGGCFGIPEKNRLIITKIGDDQYKVVVTDKDPNASYLNAPKEKTYIVSEAELSKYITNDEPMEKNNPTICTFA